MSERALPGSTYRLQLRPEFGFDHAKEIAPYLAKLGITHAYCSPVARAAAGSAHGYDVVDPTRLNPELGGEAAYERLCLSLGRAGLSQVIDIVPNHMCVSSPLNPYWRDTLESGPASEHAAVFDIRWEALSPPAVLIPVLGDHYGRELEAGRFRVVLDHAEVSVRYFEHNYPIAPGSLAESLRACAVTHASPRLRALADLAERLAHGGRAHSHAGGEAEPKQRPGAAAFRDLLAELSADERSILERALTALSRDPAQLDALLRRQFYRLAYWQLGDFALNYRRFFNIESLAGVRVEEPCVFSRFHALPLSLIQRGAVTGLRVDHVDGLRDPITYLERLREAAPDAYLVVEKILEAGERLPQAAPVEGTSGYDFLIRVNELYVDAAQEAAMTRIYTGYTGESADYAQVVYRAKHQIMGRELCAEVDAMVHALAHICQQHRRQRDHSLPVLRDALSELIAAFSVYRVYVRPGERAGDADVLHTREAIERARKRRPELDPELLELLGDLLLLRYPADAELDWGLRLSQLTGPTMAKGVEDTTFYRYARLVSLNEVGGDPSRYGCTPQVFHQRTQDAAEHAPHSMLTLSTHDTKRSADVRARIHGLSEIPDAFEALLSDLSDLVAPHRSTAGPDRNFEYFFFQNWLGAFPVGPERMLAFAQKAISEAKAHTHYARPNAAYEDAVARFVSGVMSDVRVAARVERFLRESRLVEVGRSNALSQTALLLTCPGVPDIYQGSELWDLSLVDPDNRRPVDYALRERLLAELEAERTLPSLGDDHVGVHKLLLVSRLLQHRRQQPALYANGRYTPLAVHGTHSHRALGFSRERLTVIVPLGRTAVVETLCDTYATLAPGQHKNLVTGEAEAGGRRPLGELWRDFPVFVAQRIP